MMMKKREVDQRDQNQGDFLPCSALSRMSGGVYFEMLSCFTRTETDSTSASSNN